MQLFSPDKVVSVPRLFGLLAVVLGIAILLLGAYLSWNSIQARLALQQAGERVETQAEQLADRIGLVQRTLNREDVVDLAWRQLDQSGSRDDLLALLSDNGVRNVLNVVVAPEPIEATDLSRLPGSGFAALDMLVMARDQGTAPAQVHFAGTPDEYIAFSQRIQRAADGVAYMEAVDESGTANEPENVAQLASETVNGNVSVPLAVIFIGLPVSAVANQVQLPDGVDGVRLVQTGGDQPFQLRSIGQNVPGSAQSAAVPGSLFELQWYRASMIGPLSWFQIGALLTVAALLALLGYLVLQRNPIAPIKAAAEAAPEPSSETPVKPSAQERVEPSLQEPVLPSAAESTPSPTSQPDTEASEPDTHDELLQDGEVRRANRAQRTLDAPELLSGTDAEPSPDPQAFDPDAPADEPGELNRMLESLMDDEQSPTSETTNNKDQADMADTTESATMQALDIPDASIFRAYDIRGVVGDTLNESKAVSIGRAIGSEAIDRGLSQIAIARDGRLSGASLLAATARGLVESGLEVIDVGAVPTPVLYYAANELTGGSGVMITGSHNPPDYNGFKIMLGGETLSGDTISALHQRLSEGRLHQGEGQITEHRISVQYIERVSTDIQLERPLKVVVDCGNGIAGNIAPKLLSAIGAEVIPLYAEVDGTFPNHHPDPGDPSTLEDLKLCVHNFNADVGVAFDGDGDRLGVVSKDGEIIYPDRLMMLFARDVLSRNADAPIIFDVKCSGLLPEVIEEAGGKPIMARTGHSFIKARLKQEQAPLAGEMSGHFFFAERWYGFDDGIYAAARLLEILAAEKRPPAQVLAELPKAESTPELKIEMEEGQPHAFIEEFASKAEFENSTLTTIDGLRADFEDGWGLVRASNTTPVLVIRFEGNDKKALIRIQKQFRDQILIINPSLNLPF